jgi:hypothetical protein
LEICGFYATGLFVPQRMQAAEDALSFSRPVQKKPGAVTRPGRI